MPDETQSLISLRYNTVDMVSPSEVTIDHDSTVFVGGSYFEG